MSASRWMAELRKLGRSGALDAPAVVNAARDKDSALHACFTWDDSEAGQKWRLHEARNLIRVFSSREMEKAEPDTRNVFVSLRSDRGEGNGYRSLSSVLSDDELREKLLADALEDMKYFRLKYKKLSELRPVFAAMDSVKPRRREKLKAAA
jgi:hypothetical protein